MKKLNYSILITEEQDIWNGFLSYLTKNFKINDNNFSRDELK